MATREDVRQKLITYTKPMEPLLFMISFLFLFILGFSIYGFGKVQQRFYRNRDAADTVDFGTASWFMLSAILQQGMDYMGLSGWKQTEFCCIFHLI